jgi:sulfur-oxidizing protein SoxY
MVVLSRREMLVLGAGAVTLLAEVAPAWATPDEARAEIAKFTGGKALEQGNITIELPEIAENGNAVPLGIVVESPMTADNRITDILVVADGNPRPGVAAFHLSPMSGRAEASTRIRLAATENIIVVAKTSDGRFLTAQKQIKVTIGGCGG